MKNIFQKICFFFIISFTVGIFNISNTIAAEISKKRFSIGDTITISGIEFGNPNKYSNVCFNDENHCVSYGTKSMLLKTNGRTKNT